MAGTGNKKKKTIIMLATSSKTRGGISAVINSYRSTSIWKDFDIVWIETHIDKSFFHKLYYFGKSFLRYLFFINASSLVHVHLSSPISAFRKFPYIVLARLFKKPVIVHFHAGQGPFSVNSSIDKNYAFLYRAIFTKAQAIIVLSESWKKGISSFLSKSAVEKIIVLRNPSCPVLNKMIYPKTNTILFAGSIQPQKGYIDLIRAFAQIAPEFPDWQLVFAGSGEINKAEKVVRDFNLEHKVVFKGWVSGIEKDKCFKQANVFCLPSYAEGLPMAILDAWSYDLPVITTPVGSIKDIGIDGENMLLFQPGNIEALASRIKLLIQDNELQKTIVKNAKVLIEKEFSLEVIAEDLKRIYTNHIK